MPKLRMVKADSLADGQAVSFRFVRDGKPVNALVARFQGRVVAYENVCQHLPITLDFADAHFFTRDQRYLICQTHGAIYEPLTGLCVRGPCAGASLKPLKIETAAGWVVLAEPGATKWKPPRRVPSPSAPPSSEA